MKIEVNKRRLIVTRKIVEQISNSHVRKPAKNIKFRTSNINSDLLMEMELENELEKNQKRT